MTCSEAEPLLNAYLDGELDLAACLNVEGHLSDCRTCQSQYAALERLREEIAAANPRYEPSQGFERKIRSSLSVSRRPSVWRTATVFAGAAAAALILFFVVPTHKNIVASSDDREILDNHLRSLTLNHLVDVPSSDQHTVKPWFNGKTSFSPPVPDLTSQGFPLVGGRLEFLHQQPTATLVYKRRQHVINLYISPASRPQTNRTEVEMAGYHLLRWTNKSLSYSAVSDLNVAELRLFADQFQSR